MRLATITSALAMGALVLAIVLAILMPVVSINQLVR